MRWSCRCRPKGGHEEDEEGGRVSGPHTGVLSVF